MKPKIVFINYSSPADRSDRQRRREVASHIGTYFRNRSRPAAKREKRSRESLGTRGDKQRDLNSATEQVSRQPSTVLQLQLQLPAWRLQPATVSPLALRDGTGFRVDPFSSFPILQTDRLVTAIDYFFEAYAPTYLVRSHLSLRASSKAIIQNYFRYAMQHAVMLESIVTLSFASMNVENWVGDQLDLDTAYHYGSTLKRLRETLTNEIQLQEDATFLAVLTLVRAEYILGNVDAYRAHRTALIQISKRRGGLDAIGWQEIIRPAVAGMLVQCQFFMSSLSGRLRNVATTGHDDTGLGDMALLTPLTYPIEAHAYTLPTGLQRLAEQTRLSEEVISLARVSINNPLINLRHGSRAANTAFNIELIEHVERLISLCQHSLADEICLMALHRELYDLSAAERFSSFYLDMVMHWTRRCLEMVDQIDPDDESLVEVFIWACFKNGGTMVAPFLKMETNDPTDLRMQMMVKIRNRYWQMQGWDYLQELLMRFTPMEECVKYWKLTWDRLCRVQATQRPRDADD